MFGRDLQMLRRVAAEHEQREPHLVLDPLALRVSCGPQFEVLDAIVRPIAVEVVDDLVILERAGEGARHLQAVLADLGLAIHQPPFLRDDRHARTSSRGSTIPRP